MSFLKDVIESLGSIFTSDSSLSTPSSTGNSSTDQTAAGMDGVATGNERVAYKLKGYFDLAKEEIAKAVRAEEWGLAEDAIAHYQNAQRILTEGNSTPVPSYIASSELDKVKSYRQKISLWQGQVADRLQILGRRSGGTSTIKVWTAYANVSKNLKYNLENVTIFEALVELKMPNNCKFVEYQLNLDPNPTTRVHTAAVSPSSVKKATPLKPSSPRTGNSVVQRQNNNAGSSKPEKGANDGYDAKLVEMINTVIVDRSPSVKWEDIAGLDKAKQALLEMVILPTKRKDLFTGLRKPARGLLLFGPPGTGKTMLAKAVASESEATFFSVSASSLTSKWVGEGEKLVRTLFNVAISRQPSVIFMDEIDSVMSTRTSNENEASRRLKSEFLVQFDGVTSNSEDLVIVIGATNKPQELDDAVLRRLVKRIYIPLPDAKVRCQLLRNKLKGQQFSLPDRDLERLVERTEGYSGSDLQALCEEAAMMPLRELGANILTVKANQVRRLNYGDFQKAMTVVRPSVQKSKWKELEQWNQEFGAN